ncbi:hypothetical protein ACIQ9J_06470 [Streptomyces sp. NPDC094153]|uniref:hypothetical protein n=1 Tax=Streptomyces sp. NPDC094153 TaxID=3366058 RepID=UPI00381345C2
MDIELVAATSSALLAQGFLAEAGKRTWQGTTALLETIRRRFQGNRSVESTLERLEQEPRNEAALTTMTHLLTASMMNDAQFFRTLRELVEQAPNTSISPEFVSKIYNNYQNARIEKIVNIETVHGDLNF